MIWFYSTYNNIFRVTDAFWLTLHFASTFVTILAVRKIFRITNALSLTNSHAMIDKKILLLHVSVLFLQMIATLLYMSTDIFPQLPY